MSKSVALVIIFALSMITAVFAQAPPEQGGGGMITTDGDNPLTTSFTWEGNGSAIVMAQAFVGLSQISGSFVLFSIPQGSNIIKAIYAVTGWQQGYANATATFDGNYLGSIPPVTNDVDHTFYLSLYNWDVTAMIDGNRSYPFTGSGLNNSYLAYLVVVFENSSLPHAQIVINEGAESLQNSFSTTGFSNLSPGNGTIITVVEAADDGDELGELIEFNGLTLAGPDSVFNGNIGEYADYHEFYVNNIQGEDSLTITTGMDWFGIHLAVIIGLGTQSDIDETVHSPIEFSPPGNYPNPFNATTTISYALPISSHVSIEIYDVLGRVVETIDAGRQGAGEHLVIWNAADRSSGLYFYKIQAGI